MKDSSNQRPDRGFWHRLSHRSFRKRKITTKNLKRLCAEHKTEEKTLVVHSEDVDYRPYFPNAYTVTKRQSVPADLHVDLYYRALSNIESESYSVILCTGLLEHIPDPQRLIDELRRILRPGGKLIISASGVFSIHEGPNDFYHFTPFSFKLLFAQWDRIEVLRGSCGPFETIAILIQRTLMQCQISPPVRLLVEPLVGLLPMLDSFVAVQYDTAGRRTPEHRIDSMLPSNIQAVVVK